MTTLRDAAINYATLGWHVFPLKPKDKTPLTPHGVKDATRDVEQIHRWWTQYPNANIGIACGPSGLVVVDLDGQEGAESWRDLKQKYALNDQTVTCLTPRGQHLYFASNGLVIRNSAGKLGPGFDVRGDGGYVVAPPSVHPSGAAYEWEVEYSPFECALQPLPDALVRLLTEERPATPQASPQVSDSVATGGDVIPEGRRNDTLTRLAGAMRRHGASEAEILAALLKANAERCAPPLPEEEVRRIAASVSRYPPAEDPDTVAEQKDYGHAAVLARLFRDRYRWAVHRGRWMRYDGRVWRPDAEEHVAKEAADALRQHYAAQLTRAEDKATVLDLTRKVAEICIYTRIMGALNFLKGWDGILTTPDEWDRDPWLLNVNNGTLDLRTGELRPHDPADLCTKLAPVDFDPDAKGPRWEAHVNRFLPNPNVRRQVQRDLGRALPGVTLEESLPIWYGTGANGKTTTARVLLGVLGDYADRAAPNLLVQSKYERHPTEVADLCGRRLAFSIEVDQGKHLAEALVKELTGGDRKKGRFMRQDFFSFEQTFSIILIVNHKPIITGSDDGIWRRIRLIPWEYSIPEDERRPQEEVVSELVAEGPAILNWLLDGLRDWQRDHHWVAAEVGAASDAYRAEMDVLGDFLAERCILGPRYEVAKGELYTAYTAWCEDNHEKPLSKKEFTGHLRDRGIGESREGHSRTRVYLGIGLRTDADTSSISPAKNGNF